MKEIFKAILYAYYQRIEQNNSYYFISLLSTMIKHSEISDATLRVKVQQNEICLGGNAKLKIYGTLHCRSGKRMKRENRVFFASEEEAIRLGYRPCGHCMKSEYQKWIYLTRNP